MSLRGYEVAEAIPNNQKEPIMPNGGFVVKFGENNYTKNSVN